MFQGLIYRFNFLMMMTVVCAAITVIFFIIGQVSEGQWKWNENSLEYNSAFLTGKYLVLLNSHPSNDSI